MNKKNEIRLVGGLGKKQSNGGTQYYMQDRIYDSNAIAVAIPTSFQPNYQLGENMNLRIRKLVPLETCKLMGFERKDYQAMRDIGQSDMQIYHECGDSIVTTCLMAIFGQMLFDEKTLKEKIENYVDSLKEA